MCAKCCRDASVLKLGASWPLPETLLRRFCESVERVFVVEELEPVIEKEMRALGFAVEGKAFFPRVGEFSPEVMRAGFEKAGVLAPRPQQSALDARTAGAAAGAVRRLPAHLELHGGARLRRARRRRHRLLHARLPRSAARPRHHGVDGLLDRQRHRHAKAGETKPVVATIGDSTFLHAGIPGLINAVYNQANITVMLLDNHITAMTGGQDHPGTGKTLRGEPAPKVDYEALVRAVGVKWVRTVDSYDLAAMYQTLREAIAYRGVVGDHLQPSLRARPGQDQGTARSAGGQGTVQRLPVLHEPRLPGAHLEGDVFEGRHKVKIDPRCASAAPVRQVCTVDCIKPAAGDPMKPSRDRTPERRSPQGVDAGESAQRPDRRRRRPGRHHGFQGARLAGAVAGLRGQAERSARHGQARRHRVQPCALRPQVWSPTIPQGEADILVALEWAEGLRWLPFLKPARRHLHLRHQAIVPPFACLNRRPGAAMRYSRETPAEVIAACGRRLRHRRHPHGRETRQRARRQRGPARRLSTALDFPAEDWEQALAEFVPKKTIAVNLEAFRLGRRLDRGGAPTPSPHAVSRRSRVPAGQTEAPCAPPSGSKSRGPGARAATSASSSAPSAACGSTPIASPSSRGPKKCTGCRLCEWLCPDFAIRVHLDDVRVAPGGPQ